MRQGTAPRLAAVPTLDELAADPTRACELPANVVEVLHTRGLVALNALWGRLLAERASDGARPDTTADRLLTVKEAADRLATSKDWLYHHARQLPFTVRNGRQLRFSERGLTRYIEQRRGR